MSIGEGADSYVLRPNACLKRRMGSAPGGVRSERARLIPALSIESGGCWVYYRAISER